ncbi:LLM class F420-dependent oxidoreductase [Mycobacterium stomatepiae]|uniref:LLM class F420-dependent oxidoreductase n=1 Tax=Mycobacterium stomatepiae TaxID=470076 RepID=A0A7I7Q7B2_9MYCO|nr:LLM class F420-dependent oxidoreductase [Mycobacterium stomatepiae]MCV7163010.1 LLM class F420-dependent oxidoreductase [Mycobacterium stomatepiae]BBY22153.1 LLM class F420-dependent oxidoreductase [Mycobacterium stomatepiae]
MRPDLGRLGIWAQEYKLNPTLVAELEAMGYGTVWLGGSPDGDLRIIDEFLGAATRLVMATGIVNIWRDEATKVAAAHRRISDAFPGRFLLGIGVGHPERTSQYQRPYASLVSYLDILEAEGVPKDELVLAALGPKVLQLAADRTAGAHPYLTTPEHTRRARQLVGPETLLAPEQKGVLTTDAQRARELARSVVVFPYLSRINYLQNLRSLGWTDNDVAGDGSDALIDALVGHGNPAAATAPISAHLDAGADHVAAQLITEPDVDPRAGYATIAEAVLQSQSSKPL